MTTDVKFPHNYHTSFLVRYPGQQYHYRVVCESTYSSTHSFYSWRSGTGWSPNIAVVGGALTGDTIHSLTAARHKLSLAVHIGGMGNGASYLTQLADLAATLPFTPMSSGANKSPTNVSYFPSPLDTTWPVNEQKFDITIGPVIILGFNTNLRHSISWLSEKLASASKLRDEHPWLVVMSHQQWYSLPNSTTLSSESHQLFSLLTKHKVDLYISGSSAGYQRSWPITSVGYPLNTYHNAKGFVSLGLGIRTPKLTVANALPTDYVMKHLGSIENALLNIGFDDPKSLCINVENLANQIAADHFCLVKKTGLRVKLSKGVLSGPEGTYDTGAWLSMVVILAVTFLLALVFRRYLYAKLCTYMHSDGGPPIYRGRLISV